MQGESATLLDVDGGRKRVLLIAASKGLLTLNPDYTGAADKAVNLVGCESPYRQLPESDG